jgi:phosphoribosylformylglycinamidine synthase subunit PurQ / glutaminase
MAIAELPHVQQKHRIRNLIGQFVKEPLDVIGMMPHPENMIEPIHGKMDCRPLFEGLLAA